jgi:hypothetical protein
MNMNEHAQLWTNTDVSAVKRKCTQASGDEPEPVQTGVGYKHEAYHDHSYGHDDNEEEEDEEKGDKELARSGEQE